VKGYTIRGSGGWREAGRSKPGRVRAPARRVETDPPTRLDGACFVCEGERKGPVGLAHDDPFCSAKCAREHYGAQDA